MNLISEALFIWRIEYEQELQCCDHWIAWCEKHNDTHGVNFHQGRRSALIGTDIALHSMKEACEKFGKLERGQSSEDLAKVTRRACGEVNCRICGKRFKDHPMENGITFDGYPFLHKGCDGFLLKL